MAQPKAGQHDAPRDTSTQTDPAASAESAGGEQPDGHPQPDVLADLEARIQMLELEKAELRDRLMRALAEAENTRKRAEKDRRDATLYGGSKVLRDMLSVYDNLARALNASNDETRAAAPGLVDGVELTLRELTNVLSRHGVARICPQPGDLFDPHSHQAMFEAPVPDYSAGQVIQVMAEGFRLHEQLLRPAQVGVSSTPPATQH